MDTTQGTRGTCTGGLVLDIAGGSDRGLVRATNQDAYALEPWLGLAVLADGLGGHAAGEVASRLAVETVQAQARRRLLAIGGDAIEVVSLDPAVLGVVLASAVVDAHESIMAAAQADAGRAGMAATVIALLAHGSHVAVCWVGDSSAWLMSADGIEGLTTSHNVHEAGGSGPRGAMLTQALGVAANVLSPGMLCRSVRAGDTLMLCSDGVTGALAPTRIGALLVEATSAAAAVDALIGAANAAGGRDNSSAVVVRVRQVPSAPAPACAPVARDLVAPAATRRRRPRLPALLVTCGAAGIALGAAMGWHLSSNRQVDAQARMEAELRRCRTQLAETVRTIIAPGGNHGGRRSP